jgi:hypothetical protein
VPFRRGEPPLHGVEQWLLGEGDGRFGRSATLLEKGKPIVRRGRKAAGLVGMGGGRAAERRETIAIR